MQRFTIKRQRMAGFTLLELMIAAAIGAFLIAGVFTVFSNGRYTQSLVETQTQLIDDGRFALRTLAYDIRHAGFWGGTTNDKHMAGALGVPAFSSSFVDTQPVMPVMAGDCEPGWYRDLDRSFFVSDNANPYTASGCIPNGDYRADTDVLVAKYAPATTIAASDVAATVVYVYANQFQGQLFVGAPAPTWKQGQAGQSPSIYRLRTRAYFVNEFTDIVGDGRPALYRLDLAPGPLLSKTMMVPGVEDFQVQLGVDTNNDGSVNMYVDANNDEVGPRMQNVKSVQFWAMIRSEGDNELDVSKGESQSLSMAGRPAVVYNDGHRRVVISTVVRLQNRLHLTSGAGS